MSPRATGVTYDWPPVRPIPGTKVRKRQSGDNLATMETDWMAQANCLGVDPELFYPDRGMSTADSKAVCRGCVVREECLEYALVNGEKFGIWGGLSERERRRIRRQRREGTA